MDVLSKRTIENFDYRSRYTGVPFYYHNVDDRLIYGLGTNMKKTTQFVSHKVLPTDTLDSLSLSYYNNPTLWWVIAYFNDIQDSFIKLSSKFDIIKIPAIASIEFGDER